MNNNNNNVLTVSYYINIVERRCLGGPKCNSQYQNEKWQKSGQRLCLIPPDICISKSPLPNLKQTKEIRQYSTMIQELLRPEYLSIHDDEYPAILFQVAPKLVVEISG